MLMGQAVGGGGGNADMVQMKLERENQIAERRKEIEDKRKELEDLDKKGGKQSIDGQYNKLYRLIISLLKDNI